MIPAIVHAAEHQQPRRHYCSTVWPGRDTVKKNGETSYGQLPDRALGCELFTTAPSINCGSLRDVCSPSDSTVKELGLSRSRKDSEIEPRELSRSFGWYESMVDPGRSGGSEDGKGKGYECTNVQWVASKHMSPGRSDFGCHVLECFMDSSMFAFYRSSQIQKSR